MTDRALIRGFRLKNYTDRAAFADIRRGSVVLMRVGVGPVRPVERGGVLFMWPSEHTWNAPPGAELVGHGLDATLPEGLSIEWW